MNYDDWKLMTPPEFENETYEYCETQKNLKTMKTAKERFETIIKMIDSNMIPEGCEVRLWINNCTNQELLNLGAELGIPCDKRSNNDSRLFLCVEKDNYEITLWA
jgi:hypothetical protein